MRYTTPFYMGLMAWTLASGATAEATSVWRRTIGDHIGRSWTNELIHFEVSGPLQIEPARCRLMVVDGDGERREIPYQVSDLAEDKDAGGWRCKVWCVTDLPMFGTRTFELQRSPADKRLARPLPVDKKAGTIRLGSGPLVIEIPSTVKPGTAEAEMPVPVLRMEHAEAGRWIGGGRFEGVGKLEELTTEVHAGPVFTDAYLDYVFENGAYSVFLRLIRGTAVVLWREKKRMEGEAKLILDCAAGLGDLSDRVRSGRGQSVRFRAFAPAWGWPPPPRWTTVWDKRREWGIAVFTGDPLEFGYDPDMAEARRYPAAPAVFLGSAGPYDGKLFNASGFRLNVSWDEKVHAALELGLGRGTRSLGIGFVRGQPIGEEEAPPAVPDSPELEETAEVIADLLAPDAGEPAPPQPMDHVWISDPAHRLFSKYAYNPLDEVKDYVLDYEGDPPSSYPKCVFDAERRDAWRKSLTGDTGDKDFSMLGFPGGPEWREPYLRYLGTSLIPKAIANPSGKDAELLREFAMVRGYQAAQNVLNCDTIIGAHNWITVFAGNGLLAAADLGMPLLRERERRILRARLLLLGYRLGSDRFMCKNRRWMPAFINMTQGAYMLFAFMPALFPEHPMAEAWREKALTQYEREMWAWGGPEAEEAWMECPHYALCSLEGITAAAYAYHNSSGDERLMDHPALRGGLSWLAKISTPPDARQGGVRHNPAIGNTYPGERSSLYAYAAALFHKRDPAFAAEMRWMWEQQGRPKAPTLGSVCPGTVGLHELLTDVDIPAQAPEWKSEHLKTCGVVLRNGFPSDRESMLYLIQGWRHDHYDNDLGSFFLWGKGMPLSLDWGYFGRDGAWAHNVVTPSGKGKIATFEAQSGGDYVHSAAPGWDRQILFVKDDDPLGPNYFVIRDTIGSKPGTWSFWLHTPLPPVRQDDMVRALGHFDVDMDLWFGPSAIPMLDGQTDEEGGIKTQEKTRRCGVSEWGLTQYGLNLGMPSDASFLWVIYPRLAERRGNGSSFAATPSYGKGTPSIDDSGIGADAVDRLHSKGDDEVDEFLDALAKDEEREKHKRGEEEPGFAWLGSTGKPARFTPIADGRGVKVESPEGTDYVFLGRQPFQYQEGRLVFEGTAGAVSIRDGQARLTLSAGALLEYGESQVVAEAK